MEVTYRKNLNKSYMCVDTQDQVLEQYELRMLEHCRIPELLNLRITGADNNSRYLYDISGKQQIADYLSGQKLGCEILQKLLFSIQSVCARLPEYLLRESGICLNLEFIYIKLEDGSFQFTYLPFYEKNFPEAFQSCMEQILRKIDHQDHLAVEMGYQIYQLCLLDNANIRKLLESVLSQKQPVSAKDETIWGWEQQKESEERLESEGPAVREKKYMHTEQQQTETADSLRGTIPNFMKAAEKCIPQLSNLVNSLWGNWKNKEKLTKKKKIFGSKDKNWFQKSKITVQTGQDFQDISVKEPESFIQPTELLSVEQKQPAGKLEYQGTHKCDDIFIEGENFLLGKNQEQVDGVIPADGVSRLHARIIRQEERYFIEDLNSTNGTFLNDVALEYHQPQELSRNDRIRFGAEEYVFS